MTGEVLSAGDFINYEAVTGRLLDLSKRRQRLRLPFSAQSSTGRLNKKARHF